jgi:serine/threonine-protein kinase HipA
MIKRCLYCYQPLELAGDFHPKCAKRFFGTLTTPTLDIYQKDIEELAKASIAKRLAVTGVQRKLSLDLEKADKNQYRLTVVGLWGSFILKPPTPHFDCLPENESLTMKMAALCGIKTADNSLIRLASGELAYLTRRFDRQANAKIHVEDLCQLSEKLTEHKYRGSLEKAGKIVRSLTTNTGLETLAFFELAVFCFLTGNADMHLKNFSLLEPENGEVTLAPAYDLLATRLAMPEDREQSALTINGKKNRLNRNDFDQLALALGIGPRPSERVYQKILNKLPQMEELIGQSFLPIELQEEYKQLLAERARLIGAVPPQGPK